MTLCIILVRCKMRTYKTILFCALKTADSHLFPFRWRCLSYCSCQMYTVLLPLNSEGVLLSAIVLWGAGLGPYGEGVSIRKGVLSQGSFSGKYHLNYLGVSRRACTCLLQCLKAPPAIAALPGPSIQAIKKLN